MGGGARLLSFLKLSLYIGAIDFVNIRIQPFTISYITIMFNQNEVPNQYKVNSVILGSTAKPLIYWDEGENRAS